MPARDAEVAFDMASRHTSRSGGDSWRPVGVGYDKADRE